MTPRRFALTIVALALFWGSLAAGLCSGQSCPPGSGSCPAPSPIAAKARPQYRFRSDSGEPAPWSTVVRITAREPGSRSANVGSGTVIDGSASRSLVMTCAHVLRGKAPALEVEVFGPTLGRSGSVGVAVGRFAASEVGRDESLDVGLVSFTPGRDLPSSRLVDPVARESFAPGPLCSLGCSRGEDPTALSERYIGRNAFADSGYRGFQCDRPPVEGRSGGGLFDESGRLVGVCDFASGGNGIYAETESLRAILRRCSFAELADGRRPASPQPQPPAIPPAPSPIAVAEQAAGNFLGPILAGSGIGGIGLLAAAFSILRKKVAPMPSPQPPSMSSADAFRLFARLLREEETESSRRKAEDDLLGRARSAILDAESKAAPNA